MKKPVTLGIVGARRGSSFARTALGGLDGRVQLTSVCDIDSGVLAQWRRVDGWIEENALSQD